ncbi:MAG: YitT family protein [Clostridia bacterium]|nr:YitT family protein [Clostridia bacterium]
MNIKNMLWDSLLIITGSAVFSISVNMFSAPNTIVQGGLTGIGTMANYLFSLPIGTVILMLNIPLFGLALKYLRLKFVIRTVISTLVFTALIDLGAYVIPEYKGDMLLGCIFCGMLSGTGLALVFLAGATTGGTDIIAMLVRRKRPDVSMGSIMLFADMAVIGLSFLVYREIESIMYAVIVIFISAKAIDFVLYGRDHTKLIFIITAKKETLLSAILLEIGRGASVLPVTGGYTGKDKSLILCAAKKTQIREILRLTAHKDPEAFTVVCDAGQVVGEGFG